MCLPPQRRDVGFLSQDYALFPHLTVAQNIAYGLKGLAQNSRIERLTALLKVLGLANVKDRYPRQLSGGEQQRVALARAVARRPKLLLLDEPLSALDTPTREQLRRELQQWLAEMAVPTVVVTHDLAEALTLGDMLVVMDQGKICQAGAVLDVVAHPASLAVARIVGVETIEHGVVVSNTDGQATVRIGTAELVACAAPVQAGKVIVCIRAEDVELATVEHAAGVGENKLAGVVREVVRDGHVFRVVLDCGFLLHIVLKPQVVARLKLCAGMPVAVFVSAGGVHLIADDVVDSK